MAVVAALFVAATASFASVSGASFDAAVIFLKDFLVRDSLRDNSASMRRRRKRRPGVSVSSLAFHRRRVFFLTHSLSTCDPRPLSPACSISSPLPGAHHHHFDLPARHLLLHGPPEPRGGREEQQRGQLADFADA